MEDEGIYGAWTCMPTPHFGAASFTIGHQSFCSRSMKRATSAP